MVKHHCILHYLKHFELNYMTKQIFIIVLFCFTFTGRIWAQDSSAVVDSTKKASFIQRTMESFIDFTTIKTPTYSLSMYPVAGYDPQRGAIFGIKPLWTLYGDNGKSTTVATEFSYSSNGFIVAEAQLNGYTNSNWNIQSTVSYNRKENQWYGVGIRTEAIDYSTFSSNEFLFSGGISKGFNNLYVGLFFDIQSVGITNIEGDLFTPDIIGYEGGFIAGMGPGIRYDNRNNVVYPTKGWYADFKTLHYGAWMGSDYEFSTLSIDLRHFNTFGLPEKNIFAFQSVFKWSSDNTPYFRMPIMADKNSLRGISNPNKYIDNNMWYMQVEYRRELWWRLSACAWVGMGNNYSEFPNDFFKDIKRVYGFGGRFRIDDKEKVHLRADFGIGPYGDKAIFLTFLEAF